MAWGKRQKLANTALADGDLEAAAEHLERGKLRETFQGRRLARKLTEALIRRAETATSVGNLALAWKDLTLASKIAVPKDADAVSRQSNQLVELTVEAADSLLSQGKLTHALQMIDQLGKREVMDWRADRIRKVIECLQQAENLASVGKFGQSLEQLENAKNVQPDLPFVESRISACSLRETQLRELTAELHSTTLKCQWVDVNKCCQKILAIAPKHEIALDAQRHCLNQIKRKTNSGIRATQVPDSLSPDRNANSFYQFASSSPTTPTGRPEPPKVSPDASAVYKTNSFILWIDGVGGYLVCIDDVNTIGQAIENAQASIPIAGDLRRRHARIETSHGQHLLQDLGGGVKVEGEDLTGTVLLKNDQTIELDGGVRLRYTQSHPLSKSARLDFLSRHRTHPWSDAVLLAGQSIVLGPNRDNQVFCPFWKTDLILFQRKSKWFCRSKAPFEIDGVKVEKEGEIQFNSRIEGMDFSMTLEPLESIS